MRYITSEQFKEQPEEVQQVFLDWWEPQQGDLVTHVYYDDSIWVVGEIQNNKMVMALDEDRYEYGKGEVTPLFALQQLWEFIEDKTNYHVHVTLLVDEYWVETDDWWNVDDKCFEDPDKLQAFWKCACEVARVIK